MNTIQNYTFEVNEKQELIIDPYHKRKYVLNSGRAEAFAEAFQEVMEADHEVVIREFEDDDEREHVIKKIKSRKGFTLTIDGNVFTEEEARGIARFIDKEYPQVTDPEAWKDFWRSYK